RWRTSHEWPSSSSGRWAASAPRPCRRRRRSPVVRRTGQRYVGVGSQRAGDRSQPSLTVLTDQEELVVAATIPAAGVADEVGAADVGAGVVATLRSRDDVIKCRGEGVRRHGGALHTSATAGDLAPPAITFEDLLGREAFDLAVLEVQPLARLVIGPLAPPGAVAREVPGEHADERRIAPDARPVYPNSILGAS